MIIVQKVRRGRKAGHQTEQSVIPGEGKDRILYLISRIRPAFFAHAHAADVDSVHDDASEILHWICNRRNGIVSRLKIYGAIGSFLPDVFVIFHPC